MNCSSCGQPVAEGLASCPFCGNAMSDTPPTPAAEPGGAAPSATPIAPTAVSAERREETPQGLVIGAIVCCVLALLILPPLFGGIAMYLGYRVRATNQELGTNLMIAGAGSIIVGAIIGILIWL
jgi:hypothetical protein